MCVQYLYVGAETFWNNYYILTKFNAYFFVWPDAKLQGSGAQHFELLWFLFWDTRGLQLPILTLFRSRKDDVIGSTLAMDTSILLRCTCSPILSRAPRTRLRPAWGVICSVPHTIVSYSLSWMFENPKTSNVPDSCQRLRSVLGETLTILPISVHENPKRRSSESRGLPWLPLLGLEMFHLRLQTLCFL